MPEGGVGMPFWGMSSPEGGDGKEPGIGVGGAGGVGKVNCGVGAGVVGGFDGSTGVGVGTELGAPEK
jgi:hypothetical protein